MRTVHPAILCLATAIVLGCDKPQSEKAAPPAINPAGARSPQPPTKPLIPVVQVADWCKGHGVPESICTRCNDSLAAKFKEKGDWCKQHNLPDSQCFECHPELKEKFAADYRARYGKEPPAMEPE